MPANLIRRQRTRNTLIVVVLVTATFLGLKLVQYEHIKQATTRHYSSLEQLLKDVQSLGGQVILCQNGVCQDIQTHETVANGRNGYYIVYPKSSDADRTLLEHQGEELKRLTREDTNL
jgi:predicted peroxiredoxin